MSDGKKMVTVYFHSMDVVRKKKSDDSSSYDIDAISVALSSHFATIVGKGLKEKKHDIRKKEKVIWLESAEDLGKGYFNLVFKSAKYNQSREVIDTEKMEQRGILKQPKDGDEERTHLCIRLRKEAVRFTAVIESNSSGATITDISAYLNEQLNSIHEDSDEQYSYSVSFQMMPSEDFLIELDKMKKVNLLRVTMDIQDLGLSDFQNLAGRDTLRSTVELHLRKKSRGTNISKGLIGSFYQEHRNISSKKHIRKIAVEGSNDSGNLKIDTESIHMKHSVIVETIEPTNVVDSNDFFDKVSTAINELGV
jgi:hypothetical protein